ncbi:DMT family transporter [Paenibacillus sp. N3.4]|uniref:DMT family transporter n=1 Tax=Paenibacillus sp. N3.4 TaxID=2603222 RepID=UPI0011C83F9C|nr:DMT family transporter [Paenibacillus sp. N3.4]TXK74444.1 DMT family transporter [Paenibacillus sp. N3.4]
MDSSRISAGHLSAFITILIWGTTFISTKVLLTDFTPLEILFFRFIIGYVTLLLVYRHRVKTKTFKEELLFITAGLCGVTLYFLLENIALTYTLASNAGVIVSIAPFFTAVLAHFFLEGEKLRLPFFAGFIIAIIGLILVGFNGSFLLKLNPLGDLLAVFASIVWAVYSVLMRKISHFGYHTVGSTRKVFFYGLLFMVPALFVLEFNFGMDRFTRMPNLLNLLYLGFAASALCFVSWNWAVGVLGAVKTSLYIYIVPIITIAASSLILQERITWVALVGAFLTLVGLFVSDRSKFDYKRKKHIISKGAS